jgi:hypothetical protein
MKVIVERLPRLTLKQFAQKHNLTLKITELRPCVWHAKFDGVEIKHGIGLTGNYGNGKTADEAVRNYVGEIQGKLLVYHAYGKDRREMRCPILLDANWEEEKWLD